MQQLPDCKEGQFGIDLADLGAERSASTNRERDLLDAESDLFRDRFSGSTSNGQGVGGGLFRSDIETARMRRPHGANGWIKRHLHGVCHVITKLRGLAGMHNGGRNVQAANGEFGAAKLFDSGGIVGAALRILARLGVLFIAAGGLVTREENENHVNGSAQHKGG